jgi:hypothetical protein
VPTLAFSMARREVDPLKPLGGFVEPTERPEFCCRRVLEKHALTLSALFYVHTSRITGSRDVRTVQVDSKRLRDA